MGTPVDNDPVVEALPTSKSPWALPNIILGGTTWVLLYVLWYVFWELRGEPPLRIPSAAVNLFLVVGATIFASAVREWLILEGPDVEIKKDSKKHVIYLIVRACLPTGWFTLVCFVCWVAVAGFCYLFLDARIEKPEELLSKYDAAGLELGVAAGTEDEPVRTLNPAEFRVGLSELFDDSLTFLANCKYNLRDSAEIPIRRRDLLLYFFASGTIPLEALYNSSVRGLGPYHVRFLLFEPGKVERSEVEASIWPDSGPNPDFQRLLGVSCVDFMGELLKELRQAGNPVEGFVFTCKLTSAKYEVRIDRDAKSISVTQQLGVIGFPFEPQDRRDIEALFARYVTASDPEAQEALNDLLAFTRRRETSAWRNDAIDALYEAVARHGMWTPPMSTRRISRLGSLFDSVTEDATWISSDNARTMADGLLLLCDEEVFGAPNIAPLVRSLVRLVPFTGDTSRVTAILEHVREDIDGFGYENNTVKQAFVEAVSDPLVYEEIASRYSQVEGIQMCEQILQIMNEISRTCGPRTRSAIGVFVDARLAPCEEERTTPGCVECWILAEAFDPLYDRAFANGWIPTASAGSLASDPQ